MLLKCQPFNIKTDQTDLKAEFSKYGECILQFSVHDNQENETLITYQNIEDASKAYKTLNNSIFHSSFLSLTQESLSFPSSSENPSYSNSLHSKDIEILIPSNHVKFLSAPSNEVPQSSYNSPCFPEICQSSRGSSKSSTKSEMIPVESPVSVSRLNSPWLTCLVSFKQDPVQEKLDSPIILELPPFKRKTRSSISPLGTEKSEDLAFCEVCKKSIKKKSLKVHFSSKLHQSNLKSIN
jgi:hypothetical protein